MLINPYETHGLIHESMKHAHNYLYKIIELIHEIAHDQKSKPLEKPFSCFKSIQILILKKKTFIWLPFAVENA